MKQHPAYLVGQIIVFTDDPDLAKDAADRIRLENLHGMIPSGTIVVAGHSLEWTSLPVLRCYDSWQ